MANVPLPGAACEGDVLNSGVGIAIEERGGDESDCDVGNC